MDEQLLQYAVDCFCTISQTVGTVFISPQARISVKEGTMECLALQRFGSVLIAWSVIVMNDDGGIFIKIEVMDIRGDDELPYEDPGVVQRQVVAALSSGEQAILLEDGAADQKRSGALIVYYVRNRHLKPERMLSALQWRVESVPGEWEVLKGCRRDDVAVVFGTELVEGRGIDSVTLSYAVGQFKYIGYLEAASCIRRMANEPQACTDSV